MGSLKSRSTLRNFVGYAMSCSLRLQPQRVLLNRRRIEEHWYGSIPSLQWKEDLDGRISRSNLRTVIMSESRHETSMKSLTTRKWDSKMREIIFQTSSGLY